MNSKPCIGVNKASDLALNASKAFCSVFPRGVLPIAVSQGGEMKMINSVEVFNRLKGSCLEKGRNCTTAEAKGSTKNVIHPKLNVLQKCGYTEANVMTTIRRAVPTNVSTRPDKVKGKDGKTYPTKKQKGSHIMQNQAAEIKIRAERRAGEMLKDMELKSGNPLWSHDVTIVNTNPKLEELEITKMQSHRWQLEAEVPEKKGFLKMIENTNTLLCLKSLRKVSCVETEKSALLLNNSCAPMLTKIAGVGNG